jgi:hypothetical protein
VRQLWLEKDHQIAALLQRAAGEGQGG